jgi:hypothetical protein
MRDPEFVMTKKTILQKKIATMLAKPSNSHISLPNNPRLALAKKALL